MTPLLALFAAAAPSAWTTELAPAPFGRVTLEGELGKRVELSRKRLEQYDPAHTYEGNARWPGDREGRAILGQVLLARATGKASRHVDALVAELPKRLNAKGYLGEVLPVGVEDEQVLSGHGWLLRGLVEYHLWKKDDASRALIARIIDGLLLPARAAYARYPIEAAQRPRSDRADLSFTGAEAVAGWRLSTDVGCAFIMLDGATAAYEVLRTPALKSLVELMIERFAAIDLLKVKAQTHATLTATRAILRWVRLEGRRDLLPLAEKLWALYEAHGMTDHHANDNWFGRPQWTEGCAIVDSYLASFELWRLTGKPAFLEAAHHIYWNGLGFNQRPNGGFGCDSCPGSDGTALLKPHDKLFEAPDCCSMRGGEGLVAASTHVFLTGGTNIVLPLAHDAQASLPLADGMVTLRSRTSYPYEGKIALEIVRSTSRAVAHVHVFLPSWVDRARVVGKALGKPVALDHENGFAVFHVEAKPGTRLELAFPIELRKVPPVNAAKMPGHHAYRHGPLVLGVVDAKEPVSLPSSVALEPLGRAVYRVRGGAIKLRPITGTAFLPEAQARAFRAQILFPE